MKAIKTMDSGLIKFANGTDAVTSNIVADRLGMRHNNMRAIIQLVIKESNEDSLKFSRRQNLNPMFTTYTYKSKQGKTLECDLLNEDAFMMVMKRINTPEAREIFRGLISDYKHLKQERLHRDDSKVLNPKAMKQLQKLYKRLMKEGSSQREQWLYANFHKKAYIAITGEKFEAGCLDTLTDIQASDLAELRDNTERMIKKMLKKKKLPANEIRRRIWDYLDGVVA